MCFFALLLSCFLCVYVWAMFVLYVVCLCACLGLFAVVVFHHHIYLAEAWELLSRVIANQIACLYFVSCINFVLSAGSCINELHVMLEFDVCWSRTVLMSCGDYMCVELNYVVLVYIVQCWLSSLRSLCHSFTANTNDPNKFENKNKKYVELYKNHKNTLTINWANS